MDTCASRTLRTLPATTIRLNFTRNAGFLVFDVKIHSPYLRENGCRGLPILLLLRNATPSSKAASRNRSASKATASIAATCGVMSSGAIVGRTRFFLIGGGITCIHIFCYCAKVNTYPGRLQPPFPIPQKEFFVEPLTPSNRIRRLYCNGFGAPRRRQPREILWRTPPVAPAY